MNYEDGQLVVLNIFDEKIISNFLVGFRLNVNFIGLRIWDGNLTQAAVTNLQFTSLKVVNEFVGFLLLQKYSFLSVF